MATKIVKAQAAKPVPVYNPRAVWVAAELFYDVDLSKHRQNVEKELARIYKGAEVFLPVHDEIMNGKRYFTVLCEGYAYIKYPGTKEFDRIFRDAHGAYVCGPLYGSRPSFAFFPQSYIDGLLAGAKKSFAYYQPVVGDKVSVQNETLAGMEGVVHEVDAANKRAIVHIKMRSQEVVAVVPFTNLSLKDDCWSDYL